MIDKKKIEEAAVEQLENLGTYGLDEVDLGKEQLVALYREEDVKAMFRAGINWFKKNLWHDASEEPNFDKDCLVELDIPNPKTGVYEIKAYAVSQYDSTLAPEDCPWYSKGVDKLLTEEHGKITRWLYIEDLMKGGSND